MREYPSITLNTIEYAGIYLKKLSAEYGIILNVSHEVDSKVKVQIKEQLLRQTYFKHRQTIKMESFAKGIMPECRCATRNFSEQGARGS